MIEVFKTNVQDSSEAEIIIKKLLEHFPEAKINFDLEDYDKILRIENNYIKPENIIKILNSFFFKCEILE